jgi:carboxypeptidase Taq
MSSEMDTLREKLGEVADLNSAAALLQWDLETYMPPKGAMARGHQIATVCALEHRLFTAPELGDRLKRLRDASDTLSDDDAKMVSEALYDYERAVKLPESFVHEFAQEQSRAYEAWVKARQESNWAGFEPHIAKLLELLRRKTDLMGYEGSPYNALLEDYERGMTAEQLKPLFAELAKRQSALVKRIAASGKAPDTSWLEGDWDEDAQWQFSVRVLQDMGYDFEAGRQDRSVHPFTTNFDIQDVRVTTRVSPRELFSALSSSVHEGGHALYEQGFPLEDRRTPLAAAPSLGIHESQSRMWENLIGKSLPFWKHYTRVLRAYFPHRLDDVTPEQIYAAVNKVEPSLIRVEADECTYNLHIVLRFELELDLIEGRLEVKDIPEAWNEKMRQYLGLTPPDDALGCLQDIHWSHGSMGYFPTYALGNLYSAQLFEQILSDIPDLWAQVENGRFDALLAWLRDRVHRHGRRKTAVELITDATGRAPSAEPYLNYLESKYLALYT